MSDIVPALLESIESDFTKRLEQDTMLSELGKIIGSGQATFEAASDYSRRLGELLSGVLREHISADMLPDGRMYYNIAERVLRPMLSNNYELAADAAAQVQQSLNRAAGLGLKAIKPAPDMERIGGIVDKVSVAENFERVSWMLDEPVTNFTMSAVEDTIRENVDFHGRAGLKPTITRVSAGNCCEWCSEIAGKHDYPVDREIYRRHEYCRCVVLYDPGDGRVQDAHSKVVYESQAQAERDARVARAHQIEQQKTQRASERSVIRERIKSGEYSLVQKEQKYLEHVRGTPQWKSTQQGRPGKDIGALTISKEEAQEIINRYSGLGTPRVTKSGTVTGVEYVTVDRVVGQYYDAKLGEWVDTKRVVIHHGKDGSHIVPVKPERKD